MSISSDYSLADIAAATGNNGNNNGMGWGGDWSAWIIIFLIFAAFGWGGNGNGFFGGGSRGAADNYVLASDFSMLSRQMSDGFASQERKLDSINNGLCDGFYAQAQLANGMEYNKVWKIIAELMETLQVINPRLYAGVIKKLKA